jgi:hypothetical protein
MAAHSGAIAPDLYCLAAAPTLCTTMNSRDLLSVLEELGLAPMPNRPPPPPPDRPPMPLKLVTPADE